MDLLYVFMFAAMLFIVVFFVVGLLFNFFQVVTWVGFVFYMIWKFLSDQYYKFRNRKGL